MIDFPKPFSKTHFMVRELVFLTKILHDLRNFSDFSTRNLREEVMFYLFIETSKKFGRQSAATNISGCTSLEIDPSVFSNLESIEYLESDVVHHEDISEYHPHDHTNREKYSHSSKKTKMGDEECWEKKKNEIEESLSEVFFSHEESIRFDDEVKIDKYWSHPK